MACLFALTAVSQTKLQLWEQDSTLSVAKKSNRFDFKHVEPAHRGAILAADDKPLAQDEPSYALTLKLDKVPHSDAFFIDLAQATGIPATEFSAVAQDDPTKLESWLSPVSDDRYKQIMDLKKRWRADGLSLTTSGLRTYPLGEAASCLVGVVKHYREGWDRTGLEKSMNTVLTGHDGVRIGLTDRFGDFLPMRMAKADTPRKDGQDVVLTIDRDLQAFAAEAVKNAVVDNQADSGVALVMDPKTGDMLAMANWPSFDPNATTGSQGKFGFNPCYMKQLEPGSMFKILTLAKGLDCGAVRLSDTIDCTGEWHPTPSTTVHCDKHHGTRAHGDVTTVDAIARSCNVSAAIWATHIGEQPMVDFINAEGLLDVTHLQVPYERAGNLNTKEYNKRLQLATLGFGQSIACTPVGLIGAIGMLGNDGVRVEPRLIRRIGSTILPPPKAVQIVRPETAHAVMKCMEAVIESGEGTGAKLRVPGYLLAGKTGTAQKVGKKEHGYVSNFVGFVPAENPKAVILVMIDNPKGKLYYGADVAGPVFNQIAKDVIRHYHLRPTEPLSGPPPRSYTVAAVEASLEGAHMGTATP